MTPQRKQILAVVLGIGALAVVIFQLMPASAPPPTPPGPAATTPAAPTPAPAAPGAATPASPIVQSGGQGAQFNLDELLVSVQDVEFNYNAERLAANARDPMAPVVFRNFSREDGAMAQTGAGGPRKNEKIMIARSMSIAGIVYDSSNPVAILVYQLGPQQSSDVVYPGFEFPMGITVESINEDTVVLRVDDTMVELKLEEQ